MSENVVFLEFRSPHVADDVMSFLSCVTCHNKTFTLTDFEPGQNFPMMKCAACGAHIGRMGWAHDDDPIISNKKG